MTFTELDKLEIKVNHLRKVQEASYSRMLFAQKEHSKDCKNLIDAEDELLRMKRNIASPSSV